MANFAHSPNQLGWSKSDGHVRNLRSDVVRYSLCRTAFVLRNPDIATALNIEVAKCARHGYSVADRSPGHSVADRSPGHRILQRTQKIGGPRVLIYVLLAVTIIGLLLIPLIARALNRRLDTVVLSIGAAGNVRTRTS